jgi:tRNA(fMet)-specific endonuclease VapC
MALPKASTRKPPARASKLFSPARWRSFLFDEDDATDAGSLRASLELAGIPIGAYDVLIAGQARRRALTVVTTNAAEFGRIHDLLWEDWNR